MLAVRARFSPDDGTVWNETPFPSGQYTCRCSPYRPAESRQGSGAYIDRREDGMGLCTEEIVVPDAEKCKDHRDVPVRGSLTEVPVHGVSAFEELTEMVKAREQAIESPIADQREYLPPTQSQNTNILSAAMPNFLTASRCRYGDKCFFICASSLQPQETICVQYGRSSSSPEW